MSNLDDMAQRPAFYLLRQKLEKRFEVGGLEFLGGCELPIDGPIRIVPGAVLTIYFLSGGKLIGQGKMTMKLRSPDPAPALIQKIVPSKTPRMLELFEVNVGNHE